MSSRLRRALTKSPRTVLFRGRQELRLELMHRTGGWGRLARRIEAMAGSSAERWKEFGSNVVLSPDGARALQSAGASDLISLSRLVAGADAVVERTFKVFETAIPESAALPWHRDWRLGREWEPAYFRTYDHHSNPPSSGEVKYPWELSRLTFLPLLVQADLIEGRRERIRHGFEILADWHEQNPLAFSVNWYPMEAAMRGIQLVFFTDMVRCAGLETSEAELLMKVLLEHGEFIERTIEVTDNAGNHLAAELVALLLLGRALEGVDSSAESWFRFAAERVESEICRQFLPDGVNFEKSTSYHHLVLDLFLVAAIALERAGRPLSEGPSRRLEAAARYNAAFVRPDGLAPVIGDSDDAVVFGFDALDLRDYRAGLSAMAVLREDSELRETASSLSSAALWLFGQAAIDRWSSLTGTERESESLLFPDGGVFIAKDAENYLFVDVGEVGQNGQGGHGHNDLLSFELMLGGVPLVIDPGSYLYSGDFPAHDELRRTKAHNGVVIDGVEIAELLGSFRIANTAIPKEVEPVDGEGFTGVVASHTGYEKLSDPVRLKREIAIDLSGSRMRCRDHLEMEASHDVRRYLHFDPSVDIELRGRGLMIRGRNRSFHVEWDSTSEGSLLSDKVSPGFGELRDAMTLELRSKPSSDTTLTLDIVEVRPVGEETTR